MKKTGFVILHYKDYATTELCVETILDLHETGQIEIVIVDNDVQKKKEDRQYLIERYKDCKKVHTILAKEDRGFSYANNLGYYYAKKKLGADCIIVTNNDIEFKQKDFLQRLNEIEKEGCHIVSPDITRGTDGKKQSPLDSKLRSRRQVKRTILFNRLCLKLYWLIFPFMFLYMKLMEGKQNPEDNRKFHTKRQYDIIPFGACIIFMKPFVEREDRAFTPETRFYYEEYLLARRCRKKGYKINYYPELKVIHESGKATKKTYRSERKRIRFVMENTLKSALVYYKTDAVKKKPKMLYFMSVDWNWIAQRPHFFAKALENYFDITVIYPRFFVRTWKAQKATQKPQKAYGVWHIPFQENNRFLRFFGDMLFKKSIGNINQYDYIWLGTPLYYRFIPDSYRGTVIYDYMDDIVALQKDRKVAKVVGESHERLVQRADYIFATSVFLKNKLNAGSKVHLIRNGFEHSSIISPTAEDRKKNRIQFGYVGTIAEWIDFDLILYSLKMFPQLEYHFWGPVATKIPKNERIIFHGVIEHQHIYQHIKEMDCLLVPFTVNDIILAVDPVKVYEYISFGKNIICVDYPEVRHFERFVWYYHDKSSYIDLINQLIETGFKMKYSVEEQEEFLKHCTWEERSKEVVDILSEPIQEETIN